MDETPKASEGIFEGVLVVVADREVNGEAGEGAEDAPVDLRELVHDPFEFGLEADRQEVLVSEDEQRPHEHGVVEAYRDA